MQTRAHSTVLYGNALLGVRHQEEEDTACKTQNFHSLNIFIQCLRVYFAEYYVEIICHAVVQ